MIKDVAEQLGYTSNGLKRALENGTFPISKVNDLCKILEITPAEFFGTSINGNGNININKSTIDNRHYYSDSPDVLKAQIEVLEERIKEKDSQIKEKDSQIKEKDSQIKEKDSQIKELLSILKSGK
ncbi:MAG: hypothetical protein ACI30B_07690 [Paludibacteraceae bacterium]